MILFLKGANLFRFVEFLPVFEIKCLVEADILVTESFLSIKNDYFFKKNKLMLRKHVSKDYSK